MNYTKKLHHHSCFEIHAMISGEQDYEIDREIFKLKKGSFLLISPGTPHKALNFNEGTVKVAFSFSAHFSLGNGFYFGSFPERVLSNFEFILEEVKENKEISPYLISGSVLESLVTLLRISGFSEESDGGVISESLTLQVAKQYIKDNIDSAPGVLDVSSYCYLSEKQLTRLFDQFEGVTPGNYIKHLRAKRIEELLLEGDLSLREISDKLNFSSEYYLNAFAKKNLGSSPGVFRTTHKK